jgi:hypothetical protein
VRLHSEWNPPASLVTRSAPRAQSSRSSVIESSTPMTFDFPP